MKSQTKLAIISSILLAFLWVSCSHHKKRDVKETPVTNVKVIKEERIKTQDTVAENQIYFNAGSSRIMATAKPILDKKANLLKKDRSLQIYLVGHTDIVGSREYNNKLGFDRARAVKAELVERGVYERQIFVKSVGESEAKSVSGDEMMQKDRRVDLEIRTPSRLLTEE